MPKNSISFAFAFIAFNFVAFIHAAVIDNVPKPSPIKGDVQPPPKPTADDAKNGARFAASLVEQDQARTHNKPSVKPYQVNQHQMDSRYIPQIPYPVHPYFANKWSFPFSQIFAKPQHPISIAPEHPISPPVVPFPLVPVPVAPLPVAPVVKPAAYPTYIPQPVITKPTQPIYPSKPATFVVSQQIIHKPILSEKVEVIRRPVLTEVVQVVRKPVIREEVKVVKIPTYSEHVVKQPLVTHPMTNEITGTPIHLPPQQYVISDKPQILAPITTEVIQIPHQSTPSHGSLGFGDSSYGIQSGGFKPTYPVSSEFVGGVSSGYGVPSYSVGPSYGGVSSGYGTPSYSIGSGYEGLSSSYGVPSYSVGPSYGGVSSSYGTPSYSVGSGSEAVSGQGIAGSSTGSSYGGIYDYGFGGVSSGYATSGGISTGPIEFGPSYGVGPAYGGEAGGVAHSFMEPYHGCKSGECKPTANEDSSNEPPAPVPYPYSYSYYPQMWYGMPPSPYEIQQTHAREAVQEGSENVLPVAVVDPSTVSQTEKYREFLLDANVRAELANMFQRYVSGTVAPVKGVQGKSSNSDVSGDVTDVKVDDVEDQTAERVVNDLKNASPATLRKIEEGVKQLQMKIVETKSVVDGSDSKSTESTPVPNVST